MKAYVASCRVEVLWVREERWSGVEEREGRKSGSVGKSLKERVATEQKKKVTQRSCDGRRTFPAMIGCLPERSATPLRNPNTR